MRQLITKFGVFTMLVVMFISTAQLVYAVEMGFDCCHQHDETIPHSENNPLKKDCSNEGNPFQFCNCCPHAWIPAQVVNFETITYPPAIVFNGQRELALPNVISTEFWQPPRFS